MSVETFVNALIPQYKDDEDMAAYIALSECQTNRCWYGCKSDYAVALRVAHLYTLNKGRPTGDAGSVASKKEGDLSIGYAAGSGKGINDLDQTHYGKQLQGLAKQGGAFMGVTGGNGRCGC